jgi:multidrug efflux pump
MILAMTSETRTQGQMYDAASTVLAQKLSQVEGVGQVTVGGSSLPAVRVEMNPRALYKYNIGPEDVRQAIVATNVNRPKGSIEYEDRHWQILANDQAKKAADYMPIVVAYRNNAPVRLTDVAEVLDSVQDLRNAGSSNGKPSVLLIINRQPNANIIETVDSVKALLPLLRASIPSDMDLDLVLDRTPTIRGSLHETERTLLIAIVLVILVVFAFLRDWRATLIPTVAVPVSLIGTFGVMWLCGYSLNNLSLMALIIATGFVVDDAIVVLENIARRIELGEEPRKASLEGAKEVGFTVLSMSLSLIAVFIPILLMGGIVGRYFREFAVVLSVAILISLLVSVTTTPMMCALLLKKNSTKNPGKLSRLTESAFNRVLRGYEITLAWSLRHKPLTLLVLALTIALNFFLYIIVPKGFFPQQDSGRLVGSIQADQGISFQAMRTKLATFIEIVRQDPAVENVVGFSGGGGGFGGRNTGSMFVTLKPKSERKLSADRVIARLRVALAKEAGASLFLVPTQDIRVGGRQANAQYQFTLLADDLDALRYWEPRMRAAMAELPELADISSDRQDRGVQTSLVIDRDRASQLGVTTRMIDTTLNNVFGQRQVSTIYNPLNQYRVIMEAAPEHWQSPESLKSVHVTGTLRTTNPDGTVTTTTSQVPLSSFSRYETTNTPLSIAHQSQFAAATISFNLQPDVSLSTATDAVYAAMDRIGVPTGVYGTFAGTARAFQASLDSQPFLILTALIAVYLVLGMLYESVVHPLTILSTLPSAGVGAILALMITGSELNIISLIGVILLIGIVKKNAIMMIDFAIDAQRKGDLPADQAIFQACLVRFRPIMMTTMAALLAALPLAIGFGEGAELRRPLGIAIVGGLLVSQLLTLYSTPVVYLYLDALRAKLFGHMNKQELKLRMS